MKNALTILVSGVVILAVCGVFSGCEEANMAQPRRARLVGNENMQLKEQLKAKDRQIAELKDSLAKCRQEQAGIQEESAQSGGKIMDMLAEMMEKNEALTKENQLLKDKIEKFKE